MSATGDCAMSAGDEASKGDYAAQCLPPLNAAPAPAASEVVGRLLFDARQAMIDYGSAEKRGDQEAIRDSTTRATQALNMLAALATLASAPPAAEPAAGAAGAELTRAQISDLMRDAGWQNSAIRQSDLPRVERVVHAALAALAAGAQNEVGR